MEKVVAPGVRLRGELAKKKKKTHTDGEAMAQEPEGPSAEPLEGADKLHRFSGRISSMILKGSVTNPFGKKVFPGLSLGSLCYTRWAFGKETC